MSTPISRAKSAGGAVSTTLMAALATARDEEFRENALASLRRVGSGISEMIRFSDGFMTEPPLMLDSPSRALSRT